LQPGTTTKAHLSALVWELYPLVEQNKKNKKITPHDKKPQLNLQVS